MYTGVLEIHEKKINKIHIDILFRDRERERMRRRGKKKERKDPNMRKQQKVKGNCIQT